ncbi:unnamed protein product [Cuscuta epithymum]|uniref:Uncharacterized protein n=1 Tax=Cuscuta epithymum TaxID=186058 RepID=A0AAV0CDN4_9ASTE|nr:unnamed protein product [Cuscuta epithymum]CAH9145343.1 unnamed protein product [Cuscuta epithymum]
MYLRILRKQSYQRLDQIRGWCMEYTRRNPTKKGQPNVSQRTNEVKENTQIK